MGLLSRVEARTIPDNDDESSLDEMGQALREKLKRLPDNENTPYTVLTLLKAYGSFHSGGCLSLKNGVYLPYSSVGTEIDKVSIPQGKIWYKDRALLRYFSYSPAENNDSIYWIFPLDFSGAGPWSAIMLLKVPASAEQGSAFNPGYISAIIADSYDKLSIQASDDKDTISLEIEELSPEADEDIDVLDVEFESSDEQDEIEDDNPEHNAIEEQITQFQDVYNEFNCIVFDCAGEDCENYSQKVADMLNTLGTVVPLTPERPLILLPKAYDWELISDRLSKNLNTTPLISFEANSTENVLKRIKSLI